MTDSEHASSRRTRLVEQVLVKLDEETYARIERIARAIERSDPTCRTRSCAAVVRTCVARALDQVEAEVAGLRATSR